MKKILLTKLKKLNFASVLNNLLSCSIFPIKLAMQTQRIAEYMYLANVTDNRPTRTEIPIRT